MLDVNGAFRWDRLINVIKDIDYVMGVGLSVYFCFLSPEVLSLLDISDAYFTSQMSCHWNLQLCDAAKNAT